MARGLGAIALAIIGFNWGGWVTGGTSAEMSQKIIKISCCRSSYTVLCCSLNI